MKLLLDTEAVLWALAAPEKFGPKAHAAIMDVTNDVFVSAASLWEMEIKRSLGRLKGPELLPAIQSAGFRALAVSMAHAVEAGKLPLHHGDPFDRMLIAQSMHENLILVTRNHSMQAYTVDTLDAGQ